MFEIPSWMKPAIVITCLWAMFYVILWTIGMLMVIWKTPRHQLQEMVKPRSQKVKEALARAHRQSTSRG